MEIKINKKKYDVREGETVLDVCRRNGIRIPTLCSFDGLPEEQVCRLCLIETNRSDKLVTSCGFKVCEGLEVETESERIRNSRRINLELLWSDHAGRCATCKKNRRCELQDLAEEYKIDNFYFIPRKGDITSEEELDLLRDDLKRDSVDDGNPCIAKKGELCVECRRCIQVCPTREFGFNYRSGDVKVETAYGEPLDCIFCGQCVKICPTASLSDQNDLEGLISELDDAKKQAIVLVDPTILDSLPNEFDKIKKEREMIGLLRAVGFEKVFDLSWGFEKSADIQMKRIERSDGKNIILGHCSSLNLYVEKYHPEFRENIIEGAVPDEIMAREIKNGYAKENRVNPEELLVVSLSSCVAKKKLISNDLDRSITMRELGRIARAKKIDESKIVPSDFDKGMEIREKIPEEILSTGRIGVLMRRRLSGKKKEKFVSEEGLDNIKKVLARIGSGREEYDFCELMVCPESCRGGGGKSIRRKEK